MKLTILIVFIVFIGAICLVKFPDQNVSIVIDAGDVVIEREYSPMELASKKEIVLDYLGIQNLNIREIRFYRFFKSIAIDKIVSDDFHSFAALDNDVIKFNENAVKKMQVYSQSSLLEKIIIGEIAFEIMLLLRIVVGAIEEKLNSDNYDNHGIIHEIWRFCKDLKNYMEYIVYAAKADLRAEVANSYLNRLWWLLEPFLNMLVYVVVFGNVMGNSIQNYAIFIFSALLMWNYFSKTINYSVKCVRNNRDIVTKIYVPKYVLLLSNMVLNFVKLLFSLIVLVAMLLMFRVKITFAILYVVPAYLLMVILSFGIGMILLHYGVFIDDLSYAIGILLSMAMFLTGIFFDVVSSLTFPLNNLMLCLNPCTVFIDSMRNALLYKTVSNVPLMIIWIVLSVLISYVGIHIVFKNENGYVKVI